MIAVRARKSVVTVDIIGTDGKVVHASVDRPMGLESRAEAIAVGLSDDTDETLWIVDDDAVPAGDKRRAGPLDVPVRDDLPFGHPLRGRRVLRCVPAGCPDMTVDADGRVVPAIVEVVRDR